MKLNRLLFLFLFLLLLSQGQTAINGDVFIGYGGYISSQQITQGSTVVFTGSVDYNSTQTTAKVKSMNVSFIIYSANVLISRHNFTKTYVTADQQSFVKNQTFTGTLRTKIDLPPSAYNVSISFDIAEGTGSVYSQYYSLRNQTVYVIGQTNTGRVLQNILIGLTIIGGIGVIFYLYRRYFRR